MMKKFMIALSLCLPISASGQSLADSIALLATQELHLDPRNCLSEYSRFDFSKLWAFGVKHFYDGFVGDWMQRIRMKFCAVKKIRPQHYLVSGFVQYESRMWAFRGAIDVYDIRRFNYVREVCDDDYPISKIQAAGVLLGKYSFFLSDSSVLVGNCCGAWFIDSTSHVRGDYRGDCSDRFINNRFAGTFIQNHPHLNMNMALGDYRIPFSRDLDIGVGEFYPNPKYASKGWQSYINAYSDTAFIPALDSVYWPCSDQGSRTSHNTPKKDARH